MDIESSGYPSNQLNLETVGLKDPTKSFTKLPNILRE
jgi:hypothetical protein